MCEMAARRLDGGKLTVMNAMRGLLAAAKLSARGSVYDCKYTAYFGIVDRRSR